MSHPQTLKQKILFCAVSVIGVCALAITVFLFSHTPRVLASGAAYSWNTFAASADGTKVIAGSWCGYLYTSTDSGATWTARTNAGYRCWISIASSGDGTHFAALEQGSGHVFVSADSGLTWTRQTITGSHNAHMIASNAAGDKLIVSENLGDLWTSTDYGATWTDRKTVGIHYWYSVASNALGDKLFATDQNNGYVYTSLDYGATWTNNSGTNTTHNWENIASDASGNNLIADEYGYGYVFLSSDAGQNWTPMTDLGAHYWNSVAVNSAGNKYIVDGFSTGDSGYVYTSENGGATWSSHDNASGSADWGAVAVNTNGDMWLAAKRYGDFYNSSDAGATWNANNSGPALGHVQFNLLSSTSTPISGADVKVLCNGSWTEFGTTDVNGQVVGMPPDAASCSDGSNIAFNFTKPGYLDGETYFSSVDQIYYFSGVDDSYVAYLWPLERGNSDSYLAEYWNVPTGASSRPQFPTTAPTYIANSRVIAFNWANGSPGNGINNDGFLARFSKTTHFDAGDYLFQDDSDDGAKVYLDGALIMDGWQNRGDAPWSPDTQVETLSAGDHTITVEYYENNGSAILNFSYAPTNITSNAVAAYESANASTTPEEPGSAFGSFDPILAHDGSYLTTALSQIDNGFDSQVFKFTTDFTGITQPKFTVNWQGHGAVPDGKQVSISIWNFLSSAWEHLGSAHCGTDCTLSGDKTGTQYKDGDGASWVLAQADSSFSPVTITNVGANGGLLPIQWTTDASSTSMIAYDTISHASWDDYANHLADSNMETQHALTPALNNTNGKLWYGLAVDGAGDRAIAANWCNSLYLGVKTDGVWTWTLQNDPGSNCWRAVAEDTAGDHVVAAATNSSIWTGDLIDGSWVWTQQTDPGTAGWQGITMNSDGTKIAAASDYGYIWLATKTDGAWVWTRQDNAGTQYWTGIAMNAAGNKVAATMDNGYVYTTSNGGTDWSTQGNASGYGNWQAISSDATGNVLVTVGSNINTVNISTDGGATWIAQSGPGYSGWQTVSVSADGQKIIVGVDCGNMYTSTDGGVTWVLHSTLSGCWMSTAASSDGSTLLIGAWGGDIWASADAGATFEDTSGSRWYYRVRSINAEGNITTSDEYSMLYGLSSSCPFVWTYDGSKYNFIIDASSASTLGSGGDLNQWKATPFYKAMAFPNPESYVKIPHGELIPRTIGDETYYDVKTSFELNEVNYYDQAALQVIDHDPSVDVFPDYRNNRQIHTISKTAPAPVRVVDQDGIDVTSLIANDDHLSWHSSKTEIPTYVTIKLSNATSTPAHLKLVIKRGKEGPQSGGTGSDKLQYKNSSGVFVNVPAQYDPFNSTRIGTATSTRNYSNTYGMDTKVIDLSGLNIKDNEIRIWSSNNLLRWVINWMAVDTSPDQAVTVTNLAPYYADLHFRGVSELTSADPEDPLMQISQPVYDRLAKTVGGGNPVSGNATRYGDVLPLVTDVDNKFVIATQGDELALKYHVPVQAPGTTRDFLYKTWDFHKSYHNPTGDTIAPLPFNEMTQYPYHTETENYPTDADHNAYQSTYNTRAINWGTYVNAPQGIHHSLNTDLLQLVITNSLSATVTASSSPGVWNGYVVVVGNFNPLDDSLATARGFDYGLTDSYGMTTNETKEDGFSSNSFSTTLTGLQCNTLYHYRARATYLGGTVYSGDQTVTTNPCQVGGGGSSSGGSGNAISTPSPTPTPAEHSNDSHSDTPVQTPATTLPPVQPPVQSVTPPPAAPVAAGETQSLVHVDAAGAPPAVVAGAASVQTTVIAPVSQTYTDQTHHITIVSIDYAAGTVTIRVESTPQIFTLKLAKLVSVDLDNDKIPDISIALTDLKQNNAVLDVKSLLDKTAVSEAQSIKNTYVFTRNLKIGATGADVKELQKFLNTNGFVVAKSGPGSPGNETTRFSQATAKAITKFQEANAALILKPLKLKKGTRNFYDYTRKVINATKK